jgi:hypothetical protein
VTPDRGGARPRAVAGGAGTRRPMNSRAGVPCGSERRRGWLSPGMLLISWKVMADLAFGPRLCD